MPTRVLPIIMSFRQPTLDNVRSVCRRREWNKNIGKESLLDQSKF